MDEQLRLENQLCFPLYACARKITSLYTPMFKPLGLTYTQYIVFLALWEHDNVPVSDLCHRLYLDSGTLTPLLKKMEQEGYLTRTRSKEDERVVNIRLTEKGIALKDQVQDIPMQVGNCIRLSPEEAFTLHTLLYKVLEQEEAYGG
ncbi:MAG: MarR family transcriptional regulator [Solobacterium sp.]|nr:MarR family transcriptional regulator [Solobacterium sp.]